VGLQALRDQGQRRRPGRGEEAGTLPPGSPAGQGSPPPGGRSGLTLSHWLSQSPRKSLALLAGKRVRIPLGTPSRSGLKNTDAESQALMRPSSPRESPLVPPFRRKTSTRLGSVCERHPEVPFDKGQTNHRQELHRQFLEACA